MKKVLATALALSLAGSAAFAGGPVVVKADPVVVAPAAVPTSNNGLIVAGLGLVLLCAVACGGDGT